MPSPPLPPFGTRAEIAAAGAKVPVVVVVLVVGVMEAYCLCWGGRVVFVNARHFARQLNDDDARGAVGGWESKAVDKRDDGRPSQLTSRQVWCLHTSSIRTRKKKEANIKASNNSWAKICRGAT